MTTRNSVSSASLSDPPDDELSFVSATDFAIQAINTYRMAPQKASAYAKIDNAAVLIALTSRKEDLTQGAEILSKATQTDPVEGATRCRCTDPALSTQSCGCPESKKGCHPRDGYTSLPMCGRNCPRMLKNNPRFKGEYQHYHMGEPFVLGQQCSTIPVKIGGQKLRALLDSGAWHSIIPAAVVKKIQPQASLRKSRTHCVGAGNEDLNIIGDIELPMFMPTSIDPYIWEFSVTSIEWPGIDLIIGVDFLSATGAHLDYENGMAHFRPVPRLHPTSKGYASPRYHINIQEEIMIPAHTDCIPINLALPVEWG